MKSVAETVLVVPRRIDNSKVVREIDPHASRRLLKVLIFVGLLVAALGLYAWPSLQLQNTSNVTAEMAKERDRLREQNRKLRLEKAHFQRLGRVEAIATRELGLVAPNPADVVVVELPNAAAPPLQVARGDWSSGTRIN